MKKYLSLLFILPLGVLAHEGIEEHFEQVISAAGGTVKTPLSQSSLYGTEIRVPRGAVSKRTKFSLSAEAPDACPPFPKGLIDIGPPVTFEPTSQKFKEKLVFRIALAESYKPVLAQGKQSLKPRELVDQAALWAHSKGQGWHRISGVSHGPGYYQFSSRVLESHCFTPAIKK